MSITDIAVIYIWLVVASYVLLMVRSGFDPDVREPLAKIRSTKIGATDTQSSSEAEPSPVEAALPRLLSVALNGTVLIIQHAESERFIQFRKYFHDIDHFGIELCFPNAEWARKYIPKLRAHCEDKSITLRIQPKSPADTQEFFIVNCGRDITLARSLAHVIWTDIFGLSLEVRPKTPYYRFSLLADVTGNTGQESHSFKLGWLRKNGIDPPSRPALYLFGIWLLFWIPVLLGLPISLLNSVGEVPDWSLTLGQLNLSGTSGSLVFFLLYVAGSFRRLYFRTIFKEPKTWFDAKILPIWSWIVTITVPISAIMIWTGG